MYHVMVLSPTLPTVQISVVGHMMRRKDPQHGARTVQGVQAIGPEEVRAATDG